jgi:predicted HicB family RNase H-like nuclease
MKKTETLSIRLDELEHKMLKRLARRWGISLAAVVRRLIREAD